LFAAGAARGLHRHALGDMAFIDGLWRDWSPGYNVSQDIAAAKDALRDLANLAAAIGYYRAMLGATPARSRVLRRGGGRLGRRATTDAVPPRRPRRIHGARALRRRSRVVVPRLEGRDRGGTGHFFHLEKPAAVNRLIVDWITAPPWSSRAGAGCGRASPAPAARYP
jgi:hypothetical protein